METPSFTAEFKHEAIKLLREPSLAIRETAMWPGLHDDGLRK